VTPAGGASAVPAGGGSSLPLPGGFGHHARRYYGRRGLPVQGFPWTGMTLDWDRKGRVTPVWTASQEVWPGAESGGNAPPGESRGGTPRGERAPT
jgi:hypothetical protein